MAGVAAAVDAVVSNLDALLLLQDDDDDEHHHHHRKISRGARRSAAFIRDALRAARDLVSGLSAEEDRDEQRRQLSRHGHGQIANLLGKLDDIMWAIDPRGRSAPGYCSRKLRELCYDTERSLDALALRVAAGTPPQTRGLLYSFRGAGDRWAMWKLALRVAVKVGTIRARADRASERLRKFQTATTNTFLASTIVPPVEDPGYRRPPPAALRAAGDMRPPDLVGVEGQRDRIVEILLSRDATEEKELKAVAIVGDEGAGKTTLAHEVYRAIGPRFDARAWVSASIHRCWQETLNEIARQIDGADTGDERRNVRGSLGTRIYYPYQ